MLVQYVAQGKTSFVLVGTCHLLPPFSSCLFLPLWSFLGLWPFRRTIGAAVEASG